MGIKLWLDDIRPSPDNYDVSVSNADACKLWIVSGKVSHISFDHDLGSVDTGYDVACYIEELANQGKIPRITWDVHSQNPVGRDNIVRAMVSAERFWTKKEKKLEQE